MALPVVDGAQVMCAMGAAPSALGVLPIKMATMGGKPIATITDIIPFANVKPFGVCTSLMNPVTASLTAAALGVLTPGACTPVIVGPWTTGATTVMVGHIPALDNSSTCQCAYGGAITVIFGGEATVTVP